VCLLFVVYAKAMLLIVSSALLTVAESARFTAEEAASKCRLLFFVCQRNREFCIRRFVESMRRRYVSGS